MAYTPVPYIFDLTPANLILNKLDAALLYVSAKIVSVKDFGAVGDGVTNDAPAIQTALNTVAAGTSLYFPAAAYLCNSGLVVPNKQLELWGAGIGATRIIRNFAVGDLIRYVPQSSGFINFHGFDLGSQVTCTSGAQLNLQGSVVGACTYGRVHDLYIHGGAVTTLFDGILADSPNATHFANIAIRDVTDVGFGITSIFTVAQGLYDSITISGQGGAACLALVGNATHGFTGPVFNNIITQGGQYGIYMDPQGGTINEGKFSNIILDSHTTFSLNMLGTSGGGGYMAFSNLLCSNLTGQSLFINSGWNGVQFTNANMGSGATITNPNVRLAGCKNVRFSNSILAGSGNAGVNNVAVRFENDGAAVCDNINFDGCQIGFDQNGNPTINYATFGMDATAHNHTRLRIQNCTIYGNTDPIAFNGLGAAATALLRGNRYQNAAGTPTKPVAASTLRGSDWFTVSAAGVQDLYEIVIKNAANAYVWQTLI